MGLVAEAPRIDPGVIVLLLIVAVLATAFTIAVVVLGAIHAYRFGTGDERSKAIVVAAAAIDLAYFFPSLRAGLAAAVLPGAITAFHLACFEAGRRRR